MSKTTKKSPKRSESSTKYAADGLHFFSLQVKPLPKSKGLSKYGGAFVNCWVNFRLYEGALTLAEFYVATEGWRILSVDQTSWINGPAEVSKDEMQYFREAQKDGVSFVYYVYPKKPGRKKAR